MIRQYTVTLHRHEDLELFYDDMETPGGDLYIPNRAVDLAKRRPLSRNTVYWLTESEAEQVRQDPRVRAVELTLEEQNIRIEPVWSQTGDFFKGSPNGNPDLANTDRNWGLLRMLTGSDVPGHGFDDQKRHTATISTTLDGSNVDIVIVDGHIRPNHAEFAVNTDGTGGSRVNQIDWLAYSSAIGKTPVGSGLTPYLLSYDYSSYYNTANGDHGAMVAAIAAGNTQGWARASSIYNISPYNESGMVGSDDALDYIKYWHQTVKPVNSVTGNKNPTVVNISWGMYRYVNVLNIQSITHKGVTYNGPWTNYGTNGKTYQELGFGYSGAQQYQKNTGDYNWYLKIAYPITSWQADVEDLILAGIHVVVAAGNDGVVQDISGGADYNNSISLTGAAGTYYYNRRSGAASDNAINVGAVDSSSYAPGVDWYSNRGPGIDIMAPGSGIVSAINRVTALSNSVPDYRGLNLDRISVGDGTSFAAPQISGYLALLLSNFDNQSWSPNYSKQYILGTAKIDQLTDYESPFELLGTPNRYAFYKSYWITTTSTTSTTTSTTSTTTSTSTTSTTTSTSTTTTKAPYFPPAYFLTLPFQCYPVAEYGNVNVTDNVAWYNFSISSTMTLVINTLQTVPVFDTHIGLFDNNGDLIGENDDTGFSDLSYIELTVNPGTYWLAVGLYETQFNQRFRATSLVSIPISGICITGYDKSFPYTTSTTTSTTSTSTSTTTTSTSTSSTSTTTNPPFIPYPVYPPNSQLLKTWCDNFDEWGLFKDQFGRNFSALIQRNTANCGWPGPSTSTTTSTTTLGLLPPSVWYSTVTRLSILLNRIDIVKLPIEEPNKEFLFARGSLPFGTTLSNVGIISGKPVVTDTEYSFDQPIYVYNFISIINDPITLSSIFRQYSISVVTNGAFIPENISYTPLLYYNQKDYNYTITTKSKADLAANKVWQLKWGLLPPFSELLPSGIINVTAKSAIRPFKRSEFLPYNFVDTTTNNETTWNIWLRTFLTRAHDFDYQFVLELVDSSNVIEVSLTVRIIHLTAPTYESWFTTNSSSITVDPNQLYFLVLTSEQDAPFWSSVNSDLGFIDNGGISKKLIKVTNLSGRQLTYKITPNSNSRLPQGLILQSDGLIVGRPSFRTYKDDPESVPANDFYTFSVRASTEGDKTYSDKIFNLKIVRRNKVPSDNLYIRAFPTMENRYKLEQILTNQNIIPTSYLFRPTDPWFGLRKDMFIEFGVGLNKIDLAQYEYILQENHYTKEFRFGPANFAIVFDANEKVEYEIVYLTINDLILGRDQNVNLSEEQTNLVDLSGSRSFYYTHKPDLDLWYYKDQPEFENKRLTVNTIYNMKYRIRDNVGYVEDYGNLIPEWAQSLQVDDDGVTNQAPIGFVPVVIVAYTKPGRARQIAEKINQINLDFVTYEFDRYQLENYLTKYFDPMTKQFIKGNVTVFDTGNTVFDHGSTKIIDNVEQYVRQHSDDKYIKFPKNNVFK